MTTTKTLHILALLVSLGAGGCAAEADDLDEQAAEEDLGDASDALASGENPDAAGARDLSNTDWIISSMKTNGSLGALALDGLASKDFWRTRNKGCDDGPCEFHDEKGTWQATKDGLGRTYLRFAVKNAAGEVVRRDRYEYKWNLRTEPSSLRMRHVGAVTGTWFTMFPTVFHD